EIDKAHLSALNALAQTYRKLRDEERLMTTLNALFEAAVEQTAEYEASKAMEEISLLLMQQSCCNQGAKKPLPPKQIDIDCNEVFQLPVRIQVPPRPASPSNVVYPRFRLSEAELFTPDAVNVAFTDPPASQAEQSHLPAAPSLLAQNQISSY